MGNAPQTYLVPDPTRTHPGAPPFAAGLNGLADAVGHLLSRVSPIGAVKPPTMSTEQAYEIDLTLAVVTPPACIGHVRTFELADAGNVVVAAGVRHDIGQFVGDRCSHALTAWGPSLPRRVRDVRSVRAVSVATRDTVSASAGTSTARTLGDCVVEDIYDPLSPEYGVPRPIDDWRFDPIAYGQRWGQYGPINGTAVDLEDYRSSQDACESPQGVSSAITEGTATGSNQRTTVVDHGAWSRGQTYPDGDRALCVLYVRDALHVAADPEAL